MTTQGTPWQHWRFEPLPPEETNWLARRPNKRRSRVAEDIMQRVKALYNRAVQEEEWTNWRYITAQEMGPNLLYDRRETLREWEEAKEDLEAAGAYQDRLVCLAERWL